MFGEYGPSADVLFAAQQGRPPLTLNEAIAEFKRDVLPLVKLRFEQSGYGSVDVIARREAWNNWTDGLCKLGRITQEQYDTWEGPY